MPSRFLCSLLAGCLFCLPPGLSVAATADGAGAPPLSLPEAEQLALQRDPALQRFQALDAALREQAVAEAQLPDPKLRFGVEGLPTDTFNLEQEEMTQLQVGVMQAFPRGRTLELRAAQSRAQAESAAARAADQARAVLRGVRTGYLEVYYQQQAQAILRQSRTLFERLVDITESQYAAGRDLQQDVLRARLELSMLENRLTEAAAAEAAARATLGRWTGGEAAQRPLAGLPRLTALPERAEMDARLLEHPLLQAETALIEASRSEVELARQAYKPGWEVEVTYGVRLGEDPMGGGARTDLLAAMVTVDLPLFPAKRQDRRLAASEQRALAARLARDDRLRELQEGLAREYAAWLRLGEQLERYRTEIVPRSAQTARAALNAYQGRTADFATLLRAQLDELDNRLAALRAEVDHAKAQANLLYLVGETP